MAIAGLFGGVLVNLTYSNIGQNPALGGQIMFDLPEGYSFQRANDVTTNQEVIFLSNISSLECEVHA